MNLRVTVGGASGPERAFDVDASPDVLVGDLCDALAEETGWAPTHADGKPIDRGASLAASMILHGSRLTAGEAAEDPWPSGLVLDVIAGPDCGARFPASPTTITVGRSSTADVRLSDKYVGRTHTSLVVGSSVIVKDCESHATLISSRRARSGDAAPLDVPIVVGYSALTVRNDPVIPGATAGRSEARILFSPAPRARGEAKAEEHAVDANASSPVSTGVLAIVTSGASVAGMVGYGVFTNRDPRLFALSVAVAVVGLTAIAWRFWVQRRNERTSADQRSQKVASTRARHETAVRREAAALREDLPSAPEVIGAVLGLDHRLWQRRPSDHDHLMLRVGTGNLASRSRLVMQGDDERAESIMTDVPIGVSLNDAPVVGVVGELEARQAVLRWLVLQVAALHSPAHVTIHVVRTGPEAASWSHLDWLPHLDGPSAVTSEDAASLLGRVAGMAAAGTPTPPRHIVVIPDVFAVADLPVLQRVLDATAGGDVAVICGAIDVDHLPSECNLHVSTADGRARVEGRLAPDLLGHVLVEGISREHAGRCARRLAGIRVAGAGASGQGLPFPLAMSDVVPTALTEPDVAAQWARGMDAQVIPFAVTERGIQSLDLGRDPHWLVVGTPGSGKSEVLRSIVTSAALQSSPERLNIVLVDFAAQAGFGPLHGLPHLAGTVTNIETGGMRTVTRALELLAAELASREQRCADAKVSSYVEYQQSAEAQGLEPMPRLLIAFDEFKDLVELVPTAEDIVAKLLAKARKYGMHLIIGTQTPRTVSALAPVISGKVGLRMSDETDSVRIIGDGDCERISSAYPARGFLRSGDERKLPIQVAWSGAPPADQAYCRVSPVEPKDDEPADNKSEASATQLTEALVAMTTAATTDAGDKRWSIAPIVSEPLGERVIVEEPTPLGDDEPLEVCIGELDDIPKRTRRPLSIVLERGGHVALVGGPSTGKTHALRSIVLRLACEVGADRLRVAVIDMVEAKLRDLARLPHSLGVIGPGELWRAHLLLSSLLHEVARRSQLVQDAGVGSIRELPRTDRPPAILLVIDNWTRTIEAMDRTTADMVDKLLERGPSAGVTLAVAGGPHEAGDRRRDFPVRLYLRTNALLHTRDDVPADDLAQAPDGRVFVVPGALWAQVAWNVPDIDRVAVTAPTTGGPTPIGLFPDHVEHATGRGAVLGADVDGTVVEWTPGTDLGSLLVLGGQRGAAPRFIAAIAQQLSDDGLKAHCVAPPRRPTAEVARGVGWMVGPMPTDGLEALELLVVDDDGLSLDDRGAASALTEVGRRGVVVATVRADDRVAVRRVILDEGRAPATVVALTPLDADVATFVKNLAQVDLSRIPLEPVAGRAVVVRDGEFTVVRTVELDVPEGSA